VRGDIASSLRAWAQRDPQARYAVIPDAGHARNLDNPVRVHLAPRRLPRRPCDRSDTLCHHCNANANADAEELYRRYGARPWLLPEQTRAHYRGLVDSGLDGQGPARCARSELIHRDLA
jgi:hypothetical protein